MRKITTVIVSILLIGLFAIGALIIVRLAQESQNNLAPESSFAAWCAGDSQCPESWRTGNTAGCSDPNTYQCVEPGTGGGTGSSCTQCDGWAAKGSEQCNPGLGKIYRCSDTCNWIDTGRACGSGGTPTPPPVQCGDNRCEGSENGTNCAVDCGTGGSGPDTGGGITNSCSGAGNNSACTQVGQVVNYGTNQTCICSRTSGTLCGCVPTTGTTCQVNVGTNFGDCDPGKAIGSSCLAINPTSNTRQAGTCISAGISGGQQACTCNLAPYTSPTPPTYPACSLDSDCYSGEYCNADKRCTPKISTGNSCSSGSQCLSGNCVSGKCATAGTGSNSCSPAGSTCSNPTGGGTNGYCSNGNCIQKAAVNGSCTNDLACQSGLVCLSLRCRQPVDDSNPTASCTSGKWYCYGTSGLTGGAPGQGQLCNNGQLTGTWTVADACASTSNQTVTQGMSCSGLRQLSGGEALNGRFVGCSGRLNCFCNTLDSSSTVNCIPDVGNDSCGASGIQPVPVIPGGPTPTDTPSTPPPTPTVPYCGDALCASGEACERTSAGSNTFASCQSANGQAPTGSSVAACYGVELNQPDTSSTCQYCGDGVFTPGREQCDSSAPAGNGNNPTQCNSNCTLQETVNQCVDLVENGVDPVKSGTGNYMMYTLVYRNSSTTNPYPNIKLRVGTSGSPVGRDAFNTSSALVAPIPGTQGYSYDSVNSTHTFRFRWEAATTGGSPVADGNYEVRVLLDGSTEVSSPVACTENLQVQSTAEAQPLFSIVKAGNPVCVSDGSVQINYTLTLTNIGPVSGVADFVRDTLDSSVVSANISPTNINPSMGSYSNGIITWTGTTEERTFAAGQSKQYSYRITIPSNLVASFSAAGVLNQALVQFDTATTTDNTDSFDVRTDVSCTGGSTTIPDTGLFDDGRFLLIGIVMAIGGATVIKVRSTRKITRPLSSK